jgi:hypothetical protein
VFYYSGGRTRRGARSAQVAWDLTAVYEGLGRHRLTLVGYHWPHEEEEKDGGGGKPGIEEKTKKNKINFLTQLFYDF